MRRIVIPSVFMLVTAACGAGDAVQEEHDPGVAEPTAGAEGPSEAAAEAAPEGTPYTPRPALNVYVQGPDPAPGERYRATVPDDFRAEIVVTNTGDAPVEMTFNMIDFRLIRDGEEVSCGDESQTDAAPGPTSLEAGEAHIYEASFHCTIAEPGRYEVRAYMNFGAEIAPGEDRERYYVGSREIVVE
ncbi:MAG: hypothetical protein DRJ42_19590 [Deltaproteobacteria bacterium]|nr:MAG: hypothetical protein DRJ42_19590 [Deltaproteobacteria bacterium]